MIQRIVADAEALREQGVAEGRQEAAQLYFGQAAIRITTGLFAVALHEAAAQIGPIAPEAAQFYAQQAALFAEFAEPPQVVSISPATSTANVQPTDQIVLGFSAHLDPESITGDNVYVAPSSGGPHLSATLDYDGERTVTLVPENGFSNGVEYTVTVSKSVRSKVGQSMGQDWTTHFTVTA